MVAISSPQVGVIQKTIVNRFANENAVAQQIPVFRRSHNDLGRRVQNLTGTGVNLKDGSLFRVVIYKQTGMTLSDTESGRRGDSCHLQSQSRESFFIRDRSSGTRGSHKAS